MSDIILTVVSGETINLGLSIPGVQGPVGQGVPSGGTVNQVLFKQSSTNYDATWGNVTSAMIGDLSIVNADISASAAIVDTKLATIATAGKVSNSATTATSLNTASGIVARDASGNFSAGTITASLTGNASTVTTNANLTGDVTSVGNATTIASGVIVNADVNASAAIAGTKISPDFGSQTIATTGVFSHAVGSAAAPTVTFTGDLNTGIFSPTADNISIATAGVERLRVDATGQLEAVSSGTAAAPTYSFLADADTGVYLASGNTIGVTTSGVARVTVDHTIAPIKEIYSSIFYPVVTQTDIGTAPDQVPLAGMLGDMAFTNYPFWRGGSDTTTTSGVVVIDALVYERFNYTASMATGVTVQFSNLGNGREVKLYMRNTNATGRPVSIQASTSSSGHTAVNLSTGSLPGAASVSGVTLSGSTGTALVWVGNINGTIVGGLC